jgi:hypothetical protein
MKKKNGRQEMEYLIAGSLQHTSATTRLNSLEVPNKLNTQCLPTANN